MAYINNYYVFIGGDGESVKRSTSISDHSVEEGMVITDHVQRDPLEIQLSGYLVGSDAETIKTNLEKLQKDGSYVKYIGKEILSKAVITDFDTSRTIEIDGGMEFSMTIREIRVAVSAYTGSTSGKTVKSGTQQVVKNNDTVYHTVKKGDTLYSIALMYYGNDTKYTTLYAANSDTIETAAKNAGYTSSSGGEYLVAGTQLLIP